MDTVQVCVCLLYKYMDMCVQCALYGLLGKQLVVNRS